MSHVLHFQCDMCGNSGKVALKMWESSQEARPEGWGVFGDAHSSVHVCAECQKQPISSLVQKISPTVKALPRPGLKSDVPF